MTGAGVVVGAAACGAPGAGGLRVRAGGQRGGAGGQRARDQQFAPGGIDVGMLVPAVLSHGLPSFRGESRHLKSIRRLHRTLFRIAETALI
jgi:hypothetical protein